MTSIIYRTGLHALLTNFSYIQIISFMKSEEFKNAAGQIISRKIYLSETNEQWIARESFQNGFLTEYCEYKSNSRDGIQRIYSADEAHVLLEDCRWQKDRIVEKSKFSDDGTLLLWEKYEGNTAVFCKEFNAKGKILKDIENGRFPVLYYRHYYEDGESIRLESLKLAPDIEVQREFYPAGNVSFEQVAKLDSNGRNAGKLSVRSDNDGRIIDLSGDDDSLRPHLQTRVSIGQWIMYKKKPNSKIPEYHLMENLKDLGVVSEPKLDQPLFRGWRRVGSQENFFEAGQDTGYVKIYFPDSDRLKSALVPDGEGMIYRVFDFSGEMVMELKRKIAESQWLGFLTQMDLLGKIKTISQVDAFTLNPKNIHGPSDIRSHGVTVVRDSEGKVLSEFNYRNGVPDGTGWAFVKDEDGVEHKVEEFFRNGRLLHRKVWKDSQLVSEKSYAE